MHAKGPEHGMLDRSPVNFIETSIWCRMTKLTSAIKKYILLNLKVHYVDHRSLFFSKIHITMIVLPLTPRFSCRFFQVFCMHIIMCMQHVLPISFSLICYTLSLNKDVHTTYIGDMKYDPHYANVQTIYIIKYMYFL